MAIQISQARQSLENVLQDISDVPAATFLQWCQFLSDYVYKISTDIDPERYILETNINVASGQAAYPLPVDFLTHQPYGCGIFKMNSNQGVDKKLALTNFGSNSQGYYISGSNFVLTPLPTQNGQLVNRYVAKSPVFTATTDYFTLDKLSTGRQIVPDEYLQYVQNALMQAYAVWDVDVGMESLADQRFTRSLDELTRNLSRPPMIFQVPEFNSAF